MRNDPRLGIISCAVSLLLSSALAADAFDIRVLSYNIHHGEGTDRLIDLERIARVIKSVNPDIVALQEVDQKTRRVRSVDQPAELARLTGMHVAFGKNIDLQGGGYGNAVLSKYPISEHSNHKLPRFDESEQRGVMLVTLQPKPLPFPLLVFATHLDHRRNDRERIASAETINSLLSSRLNQPAILAGDLNDTLQSRTLSEFRRMWTVTNEQPLSTVPVVKPEQQIDFVLFHPRDRWRVNEVRVLDEAVASDHRAILAVLRIEMERQE